MSKSLDRLSKLRRRYGTAAALHYLTARSLEKTVQLEVSELSWLDNNPRSNSAVREPGLNSKYACRFLTSVEIASFGADPVNELAADFASRPTAGLDYCFGVVDQERLAAYSWYALRSIEGEHHVGVPMSFPANMAYMYKAFTHPDYRGKALYGIGVTKALEALASRGVTRLLTSINRVNFASRTGCRKVGFESLGNLWTLGTGPRRIAWTPRAARQLGIQFGTRATVADRSVIA
jgi:hypothetical protein